MLCSHCNQREASFHYKKISGGKLSQMHLCTECATELGYIGGAEPAFGLEDMLSDFFNVLKSEHAPSTAICKTCGTTHEQFKKSGFVGCSDCYELFVEDVEKILSRIQPATTHRGKISGSRGEQINKTNKIKNLKQQLNQAITEERYEDAAKIRDEIKMLENGGESNV